MNIPIIGWIAAAIAGLIALGVYFWNTSAKFRAVLKGLGAAFVATFKGIWNLAKKRVRVYRRPYQSGVFARR